MFQEPGDRKTNNGIRYKLRLLYSNGEYYLVVQRDIFFNEKYFLNDYNDSIYNAKNIDIILIF